MEFLKTLKANGLRKMAWGLVALMSIVGLCAASKLGDANNNGAIFRDCFIALVGFVMGSNYGEHKEKAKAEAAALDVPK